METKKSSGRECACGIVVKHGIQTGPVAKIDGLKFYSSMDMMGHPSSRQRLFLCPECTEEFIEWATHIRTKRTVEELVE